ncbi:MAG: LysR family transcriptional regulator [Paludibacterium sp.]|uniref:LysR family transcriptional regulator n=1 Tax=Paludibacterium sp. TaxID=1917523 RepID=UPI0025F0D872|nr:LysR family transcriptional regulator [Paludibacterium sp.]MBV8047184.1 LysR family transcriptional regulator [Paludibacterium sp.]MBV8647725.1 LysR family transcriptional regulator [Paludibacterium sp.]
MLSSLNLNLLRSLDVLLELRNLTRAAERLALTQSAMSRHLALLRDHFEDPLLLREGQRFVLTERAEALRLPLKGVLADIDGLSQLPRFDPATCARQFEFAGSDYLAEYMFPDILRQVLPQAPRLTLIFRMWQAGRFDILVDEGVDLVTTIAERIPDNLHGMSLGQDKPVCVMAHDHPLCRQATFELSDYLAWPHARITTASDKDSFVDHYLTQAGLRREVRVSVPFFVSALRVVAGSTMLLTLPEHLAARFALQFPVSFRPLPFDAHTYRYWLLWHGRMERDPAHQWFRKQVFDVLYHSIYGITKHENFSW